ncbi:MAG: hypothetical protein JSS81_26835 [Acidobacteria bacterium]|nr:hypothetical protein [Acidobacteriota bacterium]
MSLDIYDLLEALRKRPGLYLGSFGDYSFKCLHSFLSGLSISKHQQIEFHSFWEFGRWVSARLEDWSTSMPFYQLEEELGNDAAFERYFELLDEFKACEQVCHEKALILETHKPNFYQIPPDDIHGRIEPEKPLVICVGQYAPSNVFYLYEIYADRSEKHYPYQNSVEEVKAETKRRWSVAENEWIKIH